MPRLLRNRYLTCFYCGRKTSTRYDGRTRCFECPSCDATNYLDENGDITDPPVATDREATPARQYAVPRTFSPPSSPATTTTFCATCLKNQHLLSASLAQYLPDPDDPDYAEREKGLYRFRKNQERLYPQICADCEPRARRRLEQAAYTAKTDVLRRMIDRSASARKKVKTRGWLELVDAAGRWLWIAGFVLQLAWHVVVVQALLTKYSEWVGAGETTVRLLRICGPLVGKLPSAEQLSRWSTVAALSGAWWNPRFAQIFRGFTRHISGVPKWYIYQGMTIAIRVALPRSWDMAMPNPRLINLQIAGHGFAAAFTILIFILGPRSIRINMAPLFSAAKPLPFKLHDSPEQPSSTRPDAAKSLADLLDEISRSPTSPTPPSPIDVSPSFPRRLTSAPMGYAHSQAAQSLTTSLQQIHALHLHQPAPRNHHHPSTYAATAATTAAGEEMDWSPTPPALLSSSPANPNTNPANSGPSPHRAFATRGQRQAQPFGAAPVEPRRGPFWYRVPPAPTTPAQRAFNPPNQPRLRASPVESQGVRFRSAAGVGTGTGTGTGTGGLLMGMGREDGVAFAEPSFFAESLVRDRRRVGEDPRDGLMGMFGEGFRV
ncbi:hypothetical protein BT67DRAFT_405203, partial [Trichocladium antarcticum]